MQLLELCGEDGDDSRALGQRRLWLGVWEQQLLPRTTGDSAAAAAAALLLSPSEPRAAASAARFCAAANDRLGVIKHQEQVAQQAAAWQLHAEGDARLLRDSSAGGTSLAQQLSGGGGRTGICQWPCQCVLQKQGGTE